MERMKYGYARVATENQNAAMQHTALKRAGVKPFSPMNYPARSPSALLCSAV
jgi:hypothetical protein